MTCMPDASAENSQTSSSEQEMTELPQDMTESRRELTAAEEEHEAQPSKRSLNATAYRIFRVLQWLMQGPLTFQELNARFLDDPLIGKSVSDDSMWLYLNTLKQLGCQFKRPCPSNAFHYELISHPFGLTLSQQHLKTLSQIKAFAQKQFSHAEMFKLDSFLKKVIRASTLENPEQAIEDLFAHNRSYDFSERSQMLESLQCAIAQKNLLEIAYRSQPQEEKFFTFLPTLLYYEQGIPYVRGERADKPWPSNLRIDRIGALKSIMNETLRISLLEREEQKQRVHIRYFPKPGQDWNGLGLQIQHGIEEEACTDNNGPEHERYLDVICLARDTFYLKQKLLTSRMRFHIISPLSLKSEIDDTLNALLTRYRKAGSGLAVSESNTTAGPK